MTPIKLKIIAYSEEDREICYRRYVVKDESDIEHLGAILSRFVADSQAYEIEYQKVMNPVDMTGATTQER